MLNIILIGPQGSGKGTQAEKIVAEFNLHHIEMGAMIRTRAEQHDKKGDIIDHLVNQKGQLLPSGIVIDMLYDELEESSSQAGFLFDGFPRTIDQYHSLKNLLVDKNMSLSHGLYLHIDDQESIKRLAARRHCQQCHKGYSLLLEPDRTHCDCGGELVSRNDDTPEAIQKRLDSFHQSTQPILDLMKQDSILIEINGAQPVDSIFQQIEETLTKNI